MRKPVAVWKQHRLQSGARRLGIIEQPRSGAYEMYRHCRQSARIEDPEFYVRLNRLCRPQPPRWPLGVLVVQTLPSPPVLRGHSSRLILRNGVSWTSHSECSSKVWRDDLCHAVLSDITYVYDTVTAGQDRRCRSKSWLALQFTLLSNPAELRVTASEKPRSVLCAAPTFSLASRPWTQG